ncbi:MAG: D-alanine--D-alanine ligase [Alphaproteobacteria bacterium]
MTTSVAVLLGGWSAERDVSLSSGRECADALVRAGYDVREIDMNGDVATLISQLEDPRPDVVFNALHGRWGEDGAVQGLLDMMAIPYTHSGRVASTIAMNKPLSIQLFRMAGLPTAEHVIADLDALRAGHDPLPRPYVIKPAQEGSSVGVYIVEKNSNGPDLAGWTFGEAMAEEYVAGRELTVSVMGGKALAVTELKPVQGFYDYEAKYTDGKTVHLCPAPVPDSVTHACMEIAEKAHVALGCRGVSRSDFRYDPDTGRLVILEVNTQPGMTPLSLVPEQAKYLGMTFEELVSWMVENASCDT